VPADPPAATVPGQPAPTSPAEFLAAAVAALEALAERLTASGWRAALHAPPGQLPALEVANPEVPMLADHITARPGQDGQCWLWWSWAQRISPATDLDRAAAVVASVLRGRDS
jgi:hypothetical protein